MLKPKLVRQRPPVPIWSSLFLVLALVLGGGQTLPAQAAPPGSFSYSVLAALDKPKATICAGDVITSPVRVLMFEDEKALGPVRVSLAINGLVANPAVGKFVQTRTYIGFNSSRPQEAVFAFHALQAGTTTLTYQAEVHYYKSVLFKWIYGPVALVPSNPVQVTVVNCKYKVKTVSIWKVPGEAYTATMKDWADLTADANGNFTGQGTVTWNAFWQVVPAAVGADISCVTTLTAPDSAVDLTGQLGQDGILEVKISFHEVAAPSWLAICSGNGGGAPPVNRPIRLAPATLTVHVHPSGIGSFKQSQDLIDNAAGIGRTFVYPVAKP